MSEKQMLAARKRGDQRSHQTMKRLEASLVAIENDMEGNEGIYPLNGGLVSIAEISRRSGINEATFYKKVLNESGFAVQSELKKRAEEWLDGLRKTKIVGRKRVRSSFQERAENWRCKYLALQNRHIVTELQLQEVRAKFEKLQAEYANLVERSSAGTNDVTRIHKLPRKI